MGECGCGELSPREVVSIGDNVLAIEIYPGCQYCQTPLALTLYYFTPGGAEEFMLSPTRSLVANQYGLDEGFLTFPLIDPVKLVQRARELDTEDDVDLDWLEDDALGLLQAAYRLTLDEWEAP